MNAPIVGLLKSSGPSSDSRLSSRNGRSEAPSIDIADQPFSEVLSERAKGLESNAGGASTLAAHVGRQPRQSHKSSSRKRPAEHGTSLVTEVAPFEPLGVVGNEQKSNSPQAKVFSGEGSSSSAISPPSGTMGRGLSGTDRVKTGRMLLVPANGKSAVTKGVAGQGLLPAHGLSGREGEITTSQSQSGSQSSRKGKAPSSATSKTSPMVETEGSFANSAKRAAQYGGSTASLASGAAESPLKKISPSELSLPARVGTQARPASGGLVAEPVAAEPQRRIAVTKESNRGEEGSQILASISLKPSTLAKVEVPSATSDVAAYRDPLPLDVGTLSGAVLRQVSAGYGNHALLVAMHPAELGHVEAVVALSHGGLQVSLTPQTDAGHSALSGSLAALRNQLSQGGMSVNVTLRHPGSQPGSYSNPQSFQPTQEVEASPGSGRAADVVSSTSGKIHLVL